MSNSTAAAPGYVVGESRSESLIAIVTCMVTLSTIVLLLRVWTRARVQGTASGADEWTILVSWLFSVAFTINVCTQTKYGLGKHVLDLPPTTNFAASLELFYYGEATYYITVSLTKMSILFLYLKLIPQRSYRIVNWSMMAFVALTGFTCVLAGIFQCNPIHKAWHTDVPGTCFNQVALYLSNAGLNILQDLIIYFLPVKTLWQVQLPRKQRIALIAVFVVGAFVCLTGILRLESLTMASVSKDPTWDNYGAAIWSSIESNVGIVCASLVHLKPLIARYAPSMLSIQRTTRLPDERSGTTENSKLRSMGRSTTSKNKPFGILTEMELEDNDQATLVQSTAHNPMGDNSRDGYPPTTPRDMNRQPSGIHKMTRVTISYADRDAGRVSEPGTGG
ncbi:hypothetical protein DL766_008059 [Monosporascus sp. MC13-8B]|uniref:Rhodopsin domain-containing protein n=1 Tax=Monosporascus cannonballus TaxID=155416 RepID=A0ABY0HFN3_9PEZI|nr:hypothetical protein DL762_003102 [Monosporascus cannonballus]RYO99106.1 hypothetical protein DL763_001707 [Monosporascus cannonballus]RYP20934.1 hypothetical protein DL766_008059 [Monosporascus sp. MC13-8B]